MGRIPNGINGPIVGKVGTVVGSSRNGVPYLKGPYKKRTKRVSQKELANRKKFGMAQAWLRPITNFVREGFKGYAERVEGFVAAKSWLMKNALEGEGFEVRINPALVKISHGDLPLSANITASVNDKRYLEFTWDPSYVAGGMFMDQAMMLAYDVEHGHDLGIVYGPFRDAGSAGFSLPNKKGATYHLYLAFIAADRSRRSDSVYLGAITL